MRPQSSIIGETIGQCSQCAPALNTSISSLPAIYQKKRAESMDERRSRATYEHECKWRIGLGAASKPVGTGPRQGNLTYGLFHILFDQQPAPRLSGSPCRRPLP